ncbi:MAG: tRNA (adenosine(37)-N6)-threonylcarbamoyltransferase complex transferase subunit TsaD [Phycisphaerae bacterium]|nr:tRNA (adenosine(37)-N6)-threonylcarbamoyltransferase complex transferase subunit TsaD [Phycisphaerae bacterium]|tara:strand:+ start:298 stop:1350 length:1053 start_codon:yes stop_codon:yes gene_type:complete
MAMTSSLVLGIESSCDETAAAVVRDGCEVMSSIVATQHDLHQRYAGVVPEIASRAHLERILPVIKEALREAKVELHQLSAIGIGHEPGLIGSLLVGLGAAKALSFATDTPLVGVNHVQAHLWSPCLDSEPIQYPALGVVASGGHTTISLVNGPTDISVIGQTIDDAIGEAFDKAAAILEAGYPGGPAIEQLAEEGDDQALKLPVARLGETLDFSYSGLKTALLYAVRGQPQGRGKSVSYPRSASDLDVQSRRDAAASFQRAAIRALVNNIEQALKQHEVTCLLAGGGVTANTLLRNELIRVCNEHETPLRLAQRKYCVDNAAMIAGLAHAQWTRGVSHGLDLAAAARVAG